jgi:hypothetical protein
MKLKRSTRFGFNKGRKEGKNNSQRKSVTFAHGSKAEIPKVEGRQPVHELSRRYNERGDNATRDESCADSISDRHDEVTSFISDASSFYDRQDEEITFGEPTNKPAKKHVGGKKKKFSVFATMKQKLKERRATKSKKDKQPTLNFVELSPEEAAQYQPSEEPLFSYENWEKFMDTVAFPEKHLEEPYRQFMDYVTANAKTGSSEPLVPNRNRNPYQQFKENLDKPAPSQTTEPLAISEQWEKFMETVSFPEKHLKKPCEDLIVFATPKEARKAKIIPPSKSPLVVTMFKHAMGDRLGLGVETIYGKNDIYISQLLEGSISASTKLQTGMKILSINDKPCPSTVVGTINALCAIKGVVRITAAPAEPTSLLTSGMNNVSYALGYATEFLMGGNEIQDEKSFRSVRSFGDEDDSTCADDTTFATTTAYGDDTTVYGDDTTFADMTQVASYDWVRGAHDPVAHDHVEVARSRKSRNYELVFRIDKERGEPVGISLIQDKDWPGLYINSVDQRGKFATTQLSPGMKLVEINGRRCPNTMNEAIYVIFDTHGRLELTVEDEEGLNGHETACSNIHENAIADIRESHVGFLVNDLRLG